MNLIDWLFGNFGKRQQDLPEDWRQKEARDTSVRDMRGDGWSYNIVSDTWHCPTCGAGHSLKDKP